jgi:hypothetical protein
MDKFVIYDLETLGNLFTGCFLDYSSGKRKQFIIHKSQNDYEALMKFLYYTRSENYYHVGFNNVEFDGQIITYLYNNYEHFKGLSGEALARLIKAKSSEVVTVPDRERWKVIIPEGRQSHRQLDLYKQKHYDGKAKKTSLKWLEFTMRMQNIEEMPLRHDAEVTDEQIGSILAYNWNDVEATEQFFKLNKFETDLRLKLSENFKLPLLNASEPRMAREILASLLAEDSGKEVKEVKEGRTFRKEVHLGKCIIPRVQFHGNDFDGLIAKLKQTTVNPESEKGTKDVFSYSMNYKGINIDYGVGGVHGTSGSGIYTSDDEYVIKTVDVKSFYPNMIINYGFTPAHLGATFSNRYKWFYTERTKYGKKDPINYIFKIILNSTYGLSNDKNSFIYDTLVTMKTTINGQLLLSMLAESLSGIPDSKLIMMNTDGLEIRIRRKDEQEFNQRCREWEKSTDLELEHDEYSKIILSDVNNYIGIFSPRKAKTEEDWLKLKEDEPYYLFERREDGFYYQPTKLKGRYEIKMDWHKNPSGMIITKAVYNYFTQGTPVEESVRGCNDFFDFCIGVKKKSDFEIVLCLVRDGIPVEEKQQRVCRYYISSEGGKLVKDYGMAMMPISNKWGEVTHHELRRRTTSIEALALVTPANRISDLSIPSGLNYNYYISEAQKEITNTIGRNQLALF